MEQIAPEAGTPNPAKESRPANGLLITVVVSLAMSTFTTYVAMKLFPQPQQQQIVLLDASKLVEMRSSILDQKDMTPERAELEGRRFVSALNDTLQDFTESGVVVVNTAVALNRPKLLDITDAVAGRLGLEVSASSAKAPASR